MKTSRNKSKTFTHGLLVLIDESSEKASGCVKFQGKAKSIDLNSGNLQ